MALQPLDISTISPNNRVPPSSVPSTPTLTPSRPRSLSSSSSSSPLPPITPYSDPTLIKDTLTLLALESNKENATPDAKGKGKGRTDAWDMLCAATRRSALSSKAKKVSNSVELRGGTSGPRKRDWSTMDAYSSAGSSSSSYAPSVTFSAVPHAPVDEDGDVFMDSPHRENEASRLALAKARERTIQRFAVNGGGRGRVRGGGGDPFRAGLAMGRRRNVLGYQAAPEYLNLFTSHLVHSDYRVEPNPDQLSGNGGKDWSPAYATAYSHSAKTAHGKKWLALASESGGVKIVDTDVSSEVERAEGGSGYYAPHDNAIFDIKWSEDDSKLVTASADQSSSVFSLSSGQFNHLATLRGHTSSVKSVVWHDQNVIASAGRDGSILLYDLRTVGDREKVIEAYGGEMGVGRIRRAKPEGFDDNEIYPVMSIRNAHGDTKKTNGWAKTAVKSVTCLLALKSQPNVLASSGSFDGIVKLWDLRSGLSSRTKLYISEHCGETLDRSVESGKRSRGVVWMAEGNGQIYTLGGDSIVRSHSLLFPSLPLPISYSHPNLRNTSFYVKLAISPCERYITCGSSHGKLYTWEVGQNSRNRVARDGTVSTNVEAVEMGWNGHTKEIGAVDWGYDQIISCSDDQTNRVWRPSRQAADMIKDDPKNAAWMWAGVRDEEAV